MAGGSSGGAEKSGADGSSDWPFGAKQAAEGSNLIMWTELEPTTSLSPILHQHMARLRVMRSQAHFLIEKIRCVAQPNEQFRRDRLVPSAANAISDRMRLVKALRDCSSSCFDSLQPLATYSNQLAALEEAIERATTCSCVSVKPLQKFVDVDYNHVSRLYELLEKARDAYDKQRRKKKSGAVVMPPHSPAAALMSVNPKMAECRQKFVQAADALAVMINQMPQMQLALSSYIDVFLRAEAAFYKQLEECTIQLKNPDSRRRWNTEPA